MRGGLAAVLLLFPVFAGASPGEGRIAFNLPATVDRYDVVTIAPDGTDLRNLTPGDQTFYVDDRDPSWSPNGNRIVFASHRDSNVSTEIYVMDADGTDQRRLTRDGPDGVVNVSPGIFDIAPAWSPRGDLIAYLQSVRGNEDIWIMRPDGSGKRSLTDDGGGKTPPQWSRDGTTLLYGEGDSILTVSTVGVIASLGSGSGAVWSPDSAKIAFTSDSALGVMNADGSGRRTVATSVPAAAPAWSPDGTQLAFIGTRTFPVPPTRFGSSVGVQDVFVIGVDGRGERRLTGSPDAPAAGSYSPSWWPDGSRLFFLNSRGQNERFRTYVMNADGTCEGRFAPTLLGLLRPIWRPGSNPSLPVIRCADVRVRATVSKDSLALGEQAQVVVTIENDGNQPATAVRLVVTARGGRLALEPDALPPGAVRHLSVPIGGFSSAGAVPITVSLSAAEPDSDPTNNSMDLATAVLPCTIVGTFGDDRLYGTAKADRICGRPGADRIFGREGNDYLDAGNGDDRIYPGPGRDAVLARGGEDVVYARDGERDVIDCGSERDVAVVDRLDVVKGCDVVARR